MPVVDKSTKPRQLPERFGRLPLFSGIPESGQPSQLGIASHRGNGQPETAAHPVRGAKLSPEGTAQGLLPEHVDGSNPGRSERLIDSDSGRLFLTRCVSV
jgi:hypothetical protein